MFISFLSNHPLLFQTGSLEKAGEASESAQQTISNMVNSFSAQLPYFAVGLVVLAVFLFFAWIGRRIIRTAATKAGFNVMLASLTARLGYFAITITGLFVAAVVVFPGLSPGDLVAGLGIGSVALGFAFKDVLQNLFAGFLILLYQPFKIGDQIKVKDFEGTVEEITVRATNIKTFDGERVVMPNSELYMNAVLVMTAYESRRTNLVVGIGYDDDIENARELITGLVKAHDEVLSEPAPTVDVIELADSSVNLKIQFWTHSFQSSVRKVRNDLTTSIKYALDENGIDMPFPHVVVLGQDGEKAQA